MANGDDGMAWKGEEKRNNGNGLRRYTDQPPAWWKIVGIMAAVVSVPVAPLYTSYLHLSREQARLSELATNPNARPDSYTQSRATEDRIEQRQWVRDQLDIRFNALRLEMPPREWRERIRALEREMIRLDPNYRISPAETTSETD